ncbi:MAG: hypothetical protein M3P06_16460 [Acidobacteriota bacterium]|nr:hypothetical protein [Acidobacteriota bacterium]
MKRLLVTLVLASIAVPSFAAIQYDFMLKNTSDDAAKQSSDMTGRATIDGFRSRIEFISGNLYPPNTYVLSTDSTGRLYFVDPAKQWFTEINTAGIATALGSSSIKISNLKSKTETLADRSQIAGVATDHSRLTLTYDITVTMRSIPITQHVETEIDSWTTKKFGDVPQSFLSLNNRTGNAELDKLLETENAKIGGFPLRQIVTTRTRYDMPARTKLSRPSSRTMTRETWVTKIQETKTEPLQFTIPITYRRADQPLLPRSTTETLTFDSGSK